MIRHTQQNIDGQPKISPLVPPETGNLGSLLPEFLVQLSTRTMKSLFATTFAPAELSPFAENSMGIAEHETTISLPHSTSAFRTIPLEPTTRPFPVVGIDVSSINVGETEHGVIGALRGAVVWRTGDRYSYLRCGPLMFHLGATTAAELFGYLGFTSFDGANVTLGVTARLLIRLRNLFERWLQENVVSAFREALVLIDGSLTTGTPDNPARNLIRMLKGAKEKDNRVMAFSKKTGLTIEGRPVTDLAENGAAPCLLDIDRCVRQQFPTHPILLLGHVYVGKFTKGGYAFRVDIDAELSEKEAIDAARGLLKSDLLEQGYPETLRLAHIYSTFTAPEVVAMQRYIASTYGPQIVSRLSIRRSLFGPFGTGREFYH